MGILAESKTSRREVFDSPTSEIFVPQKNGTDICIFFPPPQPQEWQAGPGVAYNDKSCCFYTPANSKKVQEIEAEVEKNLPEWRRAPAGGCETVTSGPKSRLILNKNKNDVGDEAALCVKAPGADSFALLVGKTANFKNSCCVFQCLSCPEEE